VAKSAPSITALEFRMLDTLGILFSTVMILVVIFNAVRLDRVQPWFQTLKDDGVAVKTARTWHRRG
jgi:hypothetical protein